MALLAFKFVLKPVDSFKSITAPLRGCGRGLDKVGPLHQPLTIA